MRFTEKVEKWGTFELEIDGPKDGNPFIDYDITALFKGNNESKTVKGFYDGEGLYKVRFMPSFEGEYSFEIFIKSTADYSVKVSDRGSFLVTKAQEGNHGPVRVAYTFHFAYEDGEPFYPVGTTCYVWNLQPKERREETLDSLQTYGFNKIRFCVFPKHYDYNLSEPPMYPFDGTPMDSSVLTKENFWSYSGKTEGNHWNFEVFNPKYFELLEDCVKALDKIGVQADIILFHPYDRWGFSSMGEENDVRYLEYVIARLSAYKNVWWSMANEYDLLNHKTLKDWEKIAATVVENDPYGHLRSIHNCGAFYDHTRPWVTHCSIQRQDLYKTAELVNEWRDRYKKPVVLDEIAYEGNIQYGWGNITGEEMLRRFWEAACRGGYGGHGETYLSDDSILWWSHGGKLKGESQKRFNFLHDILKETPGIGLKPNARTDFDEVSGVPENWALRGSYYLYYYSFMRPSFRDFRLDENSQYDVYVLDTWEMTKTYAGRFSGNFRIALPGKQYMAVQIKRV